MPYVIGEKAALGLEAGDYVVRVDTVEGGISSTNNPKIQFNAVVAFDAENGTRAGTKAVWSYSYQEEYLGIISGDLLRSQAFAKNDTLSGTAASDAKVIEQRMRGQFYIIAVRPQKKDPTRFNTNFVAPYSGQAVASAAPAAPSAPPQPVVPTAALPFAPAPATSGFGASPTPTNGNPPTAAPVAGQVASFGAPPPSAAIAPPPAPVTFGAPPVPSTPPVAPAEDPNTQEVTAQLIAALEVAARGGGAWPTLGTRQIAQLHEIGWTEIAKGYDAGTYPRHSQGAPAGFGAPPAPSFAGV